MSVDSIREGPPLEPRKWPPAGAGEPQLWVLFKVASRAAGAENSWLPAWWRLNKLRAGRAPSVGPPMINFGGTSCALSTGP